MSKPKTSGPKSRVATLESPCHDADRDDADEFADLDDADFEDQMDPEERAALYDAIDRGIAEADAGLGRPVEEVIAKLRQL